MEGLYPKKSVVSDEHTVPVSFMSFSVNPDAAVDIGVNVFLSKLKVKHFSKQRNSQ